MRKPILLLIVLVLACCLASCSAPATPKEFKSEAGNFSVMTPAPLQDSVQQVETPSGEVALHLFTGQADEIAYVLGYCDYSPELAKLDYAERMLDGARDGAVENTKGKLIAESSISLEGHPGREIVVQIAREDQPPMILKGHFFMVKNRLYQVTVVSPRSRAQDKAIDDFLQSFKLLGQP